MITECHDMTADEVYAAYLVSQEKQFAAYLAWLDERVAAMSGKSALADRR